MSEYLIPFIFFCQALGAIIGATTAVWSELAYLRARKDGHIDPAERAHLHVIAHGLRFGMTLLLIASFALIIISFVLNAPVQPATTASYWALVFAALVIVYVSWALSKKKISFALGSSVIFTAWWFLTYLTIGWMPPLSFGATIGFLAVATAIFYAILEYARMLTRPSGY